MPLRVTQFAAIVLTALALVPSGAHFFVLSAKISLSREEYFIVQEIYRGWALFGFVLVGALVATLVLAIMLQGQGTHFALACAAFLLVTATLAVFFTGAFPANQETQNWTVMPGDWRELRDQWEYGHAANAVLTFIAFCALVLEAVLPPPRPQVEYPAAPISKKI